MKSRVLAAGAVAAAALIGLTGCGSPGNSSTADQSAAPVTIRVGSSEDADGVGIQQQIADAYMALHPNVTISIEADPTDYSTKLQTELAANTAPDLFQLGDGDIAAYVAKGAAADISSYVTGSNGLQLSDYITQIINLGQVNGKWYVLPKDYSSAVVYYNKDLFAAAGLADPVDTWTWADLEADAQALTKTDASGNTTQFGILTHPGTRAILPWIYSFGGDVVSPDGQTVTGYLDSAGTIAGMQEFNKLYTLGVTPTAAQATANSGTDLFMSGMAGMNVYGDWKAAAYETAKQQGTLNYGIVQIPAGPAGQFSTLYYSGFAMWSGSKIKDAAWDYLKFIETQGQQIMAQNGLFSPYVPAATANSNDQTAAFQQAASNAKMFPEVLNQYFAATVDQDFQDNVITPIYQGGVTDDQVAALMQQLATQAQSDLDKAAQ